jgi:hypothetical protein
VHPEAALELPPEDPRTYGDHHGLLVHLDHGVEAFQVEHDTPAGCQRTPADARAAAVRYDRDTPPAGRRHYLDDFGRRGRADDDIGAYLQARVPPGRPQGQRVSISGISAQYAFVAGNVRLADRGDQVLGHGVK